MILEYHETIGKCQDCIFNSAIFDCQKKFKCERNTIFEFGKEVWDGRDDIILKQTEPEY